MLNVRPRHGLASGLWILCRWPARRSAAWASGGDLSRRGVAQISGVSAISLPTDEPSRPARFFLSQRRFSEPLHPSFFLPNADKILTLG